MASHEVYNKDNKFLSKLKFKSKALNILRNIVLSLVIILGLNWVIAITTDVNLLGTGLRKVFEAVEGYNHPIPSVEVASDDWSSQTPGSWHIDKSAKWTGAKTAEVVFDLNTTKKYISEGLKFDVVMVLDVSTSMAGEKIVKLQESAKKYFDEILADNDNRVGIVEFHTSATVLQNLTNNKTALNNTIDNLKLHCKGEIIDGVEQSYGYCTNYYDGLKKAEDLLENYVPDEKRQLVIMLLTDGYANRDNQLIINEYNSLKEKYPDSIINGIQYEMGSTINYYLTQASDNQYDATTENIYDKFFNATYTQKLTKFESFEIVDYIKDRYFKVNSESDISVDIGAIKLENESNGTQKIIWTLTPDFKSGMSGQMKIKLTLKDAYVKDVDKDFYPTNTGEDIIWRITDENQKTKKSTLTPVLQRIYNVTYENNPPQNCNISKTNIEKHYSYENVKIKDNHPTCAGYTFKGWEIITDGIQKVNKNTFVMPEGNVTIRGKWGAQSISKSMKGVLVSKPTLYEIVQTDARSANGAAIYEGEVTDQYNNTVTVKEEAGTSDGIYYYTSKTHNNVIFAGFCWQMVRTTTTGGVKIVYNGVPVNGTCKDDRGYFAGITDPNYNLSIRSSDLYGDSYIYNPGDRTITLTGNVQRADTFDKNDLIGKYTCYSSRNNCLILYKVNSLDPEKSDYTYATQYKPASYSEIGRSSFNDEYKSPAYVGYMYNTVIEPKEREMNVSASGMIFGKSIVKNNNGYKLQDTATISNWYVDYKDTISNYHYTCFSTTDSTCSKVAYVYNTSAATAYYIELDKYTDINNLLNKMLWADDVNMTSSTIKTFIDTWYQNNMTDYTKYLEDIVFCNDRGISDFAGWNPNGGSTSGVLTFNNYSNRSTHICLNVTDQFAMNNSKAQLTYPVGLLTVPEADMMGETFRTTGENYWLGSPYNIQSGSNSAFESSVLQFGSLGGNFAWSSYGVRPAVSLKPGTKYTSGAGTPEDPFIIETK